MEKNNQSDQQKILEVVQVLQQQNCSMLERINGLEGKIASIQQPVQESPSAPPPPPPPPSSQADESITAKYKLVIRSVVSEIVHIGRPIGTTEGNGIQVAVEDLHGNQVEAGHDLASLKVELVVLDRHFYNDGVWDWPKEKFEKSIIKTRNQKEETTNAIFQLKDGKGVHEGTTINKSSNKHPVKLGVRIIEHSGERVLEGVSNSFLVQHWPRGRKSEEESSPRPRENSPTKERRGKKRRATNNAALPMENTSLYLPVISRQPSQRVGTSNAGTDTDTSMGTDVTDDDGTPDNFRGDGPNMDKRFSTANIELSNDSMWVSRDTDDFVLNLIHGDDPHWLARRILYRSASVREIVPPGYKVLLNKIQQFETRLLYVSVQLQPQAELRKIDELKECLQVVGETILQLTMDLTLILLDEGPAKTLFDDLQNLQQALVKMVGLEMANLERVRLTTSSEEAQYGLGGSRANGTGDQNIHGNSHGIADTQPTNSQNTPHGTQMYPSAETHHHPSPQGQMMAHGTTGTSPAYLGQTRYHDSSFLDEQHRQDYTFPNEHDKASAAEEQRQIGYGPHNYGQGQVALGLTSFVSRPRLNHKISAYPLHTRRSSPCPLMLPVDSLQLMMGHLSINDEFTVMVMMMMIMGISSQAIRKTPPSEIVLVEPEPSVKQKSYAFCGDNNNGVTESYDHFVVVDLKATGEKGVNINPREIIEFSSVLVDAITGQPASTFHTYVCPIIHPELSEFCKEYNGILQTDVDAGVMLSEALQMHQAWLKEAETKNGGRLSFAVVTWGDWDCHTMLKQECLFKHLAIPHYFYRWINLKKPFAEKYGDNYYWSAPVLEAVEAAGLNWRGCPTGGESHADNKARLVELLIRHGAKLYITGNLLAM